MRTFISGHGGIRDADTGGRGDMFRNIAAVVVFILLFATGGYGEEKAFSLSEALRAAMRDNHEIKAFDRSLAADEEDVGIARSFLLPRIVFEERYLRTNNPPTVFSVKLNQERFSQSDFEVHSLNNPKPINDFQSSLSFEQPLFSRKAHIGLGMAKTEVSARAIEFSRKREEVALQVVQAFLTVRTAKEYVAVVKKGVEDAKEHLRIAEVRHKNGLAVYSDTLRASTAVTEAEQRLVSAERNLKTAKRGLGLVLGMSEPIDIVGDPWDIPTMGIDYYATAAETRKDIKAMELRYENAKEKVKFANAGYLPVVGIGGSYQLNDHRRPFGSEGDSWQVLAFLRWELFDGTKREHETAKARYKVAETEEHLKGLKKTVSYQVYDAYLGVEEAMKNAELSRASVQSAEEGQRLVQIRYESSLSPLVDLLDAQVSLDHARATLVAKNNEYRRSLVHLGFESGTLLRDLQIEE